MVLHLGADGPLLSSYESMSMDKLKGGRLSLASASVSQAEDKVQVTCTLPKPISAKFKAASPKEAADWAEKVQCAIDGKKVVTTPSAPTPAPAEPASPPPVVPPVDLSAAKEKKPSLGKKPSLLERVLPTMRSPRLSASKKVVLAADAPVLGGLAAVAQRLGAVAGQPAPPAAGLQPSSSQDDVVKALAALVAYVEQAADGLAVQRLEGLTQRLESRAGVAPPAAAASGKAPPMDKMIAQLEGLVGRMEAACA